MKKLRLVVLFLAATILTSLVILFCSSQRVNSTVIEVDGVKFTVSVYTFPETLQIPVLYEPGVLEKELRKYPWLKAFLFTTTGIEEYIPRKEWSKYAAYDWNERLYSDIANTCKIRKENVLVKQKERWAGARYSVVSVVLCVSENRKALSAYMKEILADGTSAGGLYNKVVDYDGKWKRTGINDGGQYGQQLMNCYEKAMKLVAEGELKTNPICKLK